MTSAAFSLEPSQCLAPALTGYAAYQCCVPQVVQDSQIPRKACPAETPNAQFCQCRSVPINGTTNKTASYNCTCDNARFLTSKLFSFAPSQCLYYNQTVSECCLSAQNVADLIPQVSCPAAGFTT